MSAKADVTTKIYNDVFGQKFDHTRVNKCVKAVIVNYGDARGDIIVKNDNFGTRRKYADSTNGKREAGLNPMSIVFVDPEHEAIFKERYIGPDDKIHTFGGEDDLLTHRA